MWVVVESMDSGGFDVSCIFWRHISGSLEGATRMPRSRIEKAKNFRGREGAVGGLLSHR